jgi:hypothetical protein
LAKSQVLGTLVAFTIFLRIYSILHQNQVMWWEKASGKGKLYQNRLKSKIVFKTFKIHKSFSQREKNISANHK